MVFFSEVVDYLSFSEGKKSIDMCANDSHAVSASENTDLFPVKKRYFIYIYIQT